MYNPISEVYKGISGFSEEDCLNKITLDKAMSNDEAFGGISFNTDSINPDKNPYTHSEFAKVKA